MRAARPPRAAVETPFHGASARSALQLAHARGVLLATLAEEKIEVIEYTPATVKKTVTGNGRAEKLQVQEMVVRTLRGAAPPVLTPDVADAIAVALCELAHATYPRAGASRRR